MKIIDHKLIVLKLADRLQSFIVILHPLLLHL